MSKQDFLIIDAPRLVGDWKGKYVVCWKEMNNGYFHFPKETVFLVRGSGKHKSLRSLPCECCGVAGHITIKDTKRRFLRDFSFIEFISENVDR